MILFVINHAFHYETEKLARIFFPCASIDIKKEYCDTNEDFILTSAKYGASGAELEVKLSLNGVCEERKTFVALPDGDFDKDCELALAGLMFDMLCSVTGKIPP